MPNEQMDEQQVAAYLSMDARDIIKRASRGQMPCRKVGDQKFVFRRVDLDRWVWEQMHNFNRRELAVQKMRQRQEEQSQDQAT